MLIRREPLRFLDRMIAEYGDITSHQAGGVAVYLIRGLRIGRDVVK